MITTSTHRIPVNATDAFIVDLVSADTGDVSLVVDHVEIVRLIRWGDESEEAWINRCTTTRDAVVATCERIVKELPVIAESSRPRMEVSLDGYGTPAMPAGVIDKLAIFEAGRRAAHGES